MTTEPGRECFRVDDLLIDVGAVAVWRGEQQLAVPDLSFTTLALLVHRAPDVVSPDELVEEVWEGMAVSDETITQRIALLRRALDDDSRNPRYVRSVRGRGLGRARSEHESGPQSGKKQSGDKTILFNGLLPHGCFFLSGQECRIGLHSTQQPHREPE